jgi:hypothetical protein
LIAHFRLRFQAREPRAFREIDLCDKENGILKSAQRFFYNLNAHRERRKTQHRLLALYRACVRSTALLGVEGFGNINM